MSALPVTFSTSVLPQSVSVAQIQGDIFLQRVGSQNGVVQDILLRGVAGGFVRFDATGKLTANAEAWVVKTSAYTAVANDNIAANTTSAAFTITLPASPVAGDTVRILDAAATFDTNNLTLTTTDKIDSSDSDLVLSAENAFVTLVYINSTIGWKSFYTAAATGSTAITGTLSVSGLTTLTGGAATGGKIYPSSNDGAALGDTTHNFSDLFLASGAVVNYANGDVVVTHTAGILTMGTGDLRVTTAGTNSASVVTVGGTQTLTNKTLTAPVIGVATGTSLAVTAGLTSSGATGAGIGYATGAGGTVTQLTDATTAVTLNKLSGQITTVSLTLAAGVDTSFTLTNSTIAAGDVVVASIKSYGGTADGIPVVAVVATAAGSCVLNIVNRGAVTLDAVAVINFAVIKAVAA